MPAQTAASAPTTLVGAAVALRRDADGSLSLLTYSPEGVQVLAQGRDVAAMWSALDAFDAPAALAA